MPVYDLPQPLTRHTAENSPATRSTMRQSWQSSAPMRPICAGAQQRKWSPKQEKQLIFLPLSVIFHDCNRVWVWNIERPKKKKKKKKTKSWLSVFERMHRAVASLEFKATHARLTALKSSTKAHLQLTSSIIVSRTCRSRVISPRHVLGGSPPVYLILTSHFHSTHLYMLWQYSVQILKKSVNGTHTTKNLVYEKKRIW